MRLARALIASSLVLASAAAAQAPAPPPDPLKAEIIRAIDGRAKLAQQMVDQVFSFGELGMQEVETSRYLAGVLEKNGFTVQQIGRAHV